MITDERNPLIVEAKSDLSTSTLNWQTQKQKSFILRVVTLGNNVHTTKGPETCNAFAFIYASLYNYVHNNAELLPPTLCNVKQIKAKKAALRTLEVES